MAPTPFEEYAALMNRNGDGYYLYKPQSYVKLHPGVIGFFDRHGAWTTITDVSIPGQPEKDGYTGFGYDLVSDKPETATWNTRASSSEAQHSFGLTGGLSGALSAAPVDVSAEAKNKWGQTGKAALVAEHVVIHERFRTPWGKPLADWVKANAKALVNGPWQVEIKDFGLWAINKTWSTQECKITMDSAHNRDTSGGVDVGATGIAKGGISGSSAVKSDSKGWTTFKASEPLKKTEDRAAPTETAKAVFNEQGEQIGVEFFRPVYDENGKEVGEEKIDREADRKKKEEEEKKLIASGEAEENVAIEFGETVGETEEDQEAQKQEQSAKAAEIMGQDWPEEEKRAALHRLFAVEKVVTVKSS
ncbi:hypothetical protein N7512_004427 [Penicillium capsulatum]|nr:hypothetical protein N7512_004427 [Penicillium capsulatum]